MEITITDTLFLKTTEGLTRPSDVDGMEILCEDGEYRTCKMTKELMKDFWTLYPSNGMTLELNDGSSIKTPERGWVSLEDMHVNCGIYHEQVKHTGTGEDMVLDLEDVTAHHTGSFDIGTLEFAELAGVYATSSKVYKNGDVSFMTRNKKFRKILEHFDFKNIEYNRTSRTYRVNPSYVTEVLEACFGRVTTTGEGMRYIPDTILLNATNEWVRTFVSASLRCYAKAVVERISYSSFGARSTKYVNDLIHFIQRSTAYYNTIFNMNGDGASIGVQLPDDYELFDKISIPVKLLQGFKYGVGSVGYKISVEGDYGIYLSGFYVK